MRLQRTSLSVWPQQIVHMRARQNFGESFVCLIDGALRIKLLSPVFSQNMYQGVYEDLSPQEVPEDVSLFEIDTTKYPLLDQVSSFVQTAELRKGDCLYIPQFYFYQHVSEQGDAMFMSFTYEASSKLTELFVNAIHAGVLDK